MTRVEELRLELDKLKDKETKLEAELALKENPELEEAIFDIVVSASKVEVLAKKLRAIGKPKVDNANKIAMMQRQVERHENQIKACKAAIKDLKKGDDVKYGKLEDGLQKDVDMLKKTVEKWLPEFKEKGFNLGYFFPRLRKYIPELYS